MTDLNGLLERCREATEASWELDLALAQALVPDVIVGRQRDDDSGSDPYTHWHYTGKIDDALALVERILPGASWALNGGAHVVVGMTLWPVDPGDAIEIEAPTLPLAILVALLSALISKADR